MVTLDRKSLKNEARSRLEKLTCDPRMLVLLNTGVMVVLNLLISGLNILLDQQIGNTGGLSGLGTRSILETIQSILSYLSVFFTPFWSAGFLYCVIRLMRSQTAQPSSMLEGFRRFPSIIVFTLNKFFLTMLVATAAVYITTIVFMLSPFARDLTEITTTLMESGKLFLADGTIDMQAFPPDVLMHAAIPMFAIFFVVFLPAFAFVNYSLILGNYLIMEGNRIGGFAAMLLSFRMMKGHRLQMFKLDLSFWWYYLIESLLTVILYLDMLLPLLGVTLPFSPTVGFFVFLILYGILQTAFHLWAKLPVDSTYVLAFETIVDEHKPQMM